jgi:tetratricopeptide (TPR) repeat protein
MGKHLDRAEILLDLDKYDLAEKELRQEIAENPDSDLAHGSLARCLINQRKLGVETLEIVEYALALNPENDWLHYLLAVYWHMSGNFDRAQTAIGVSIELDPNVSLYFDTLARILFDRGNDKFKTHSWRVLAIIFVVSRGVLWPISLGILAIGKGYWVRSYLQPVFTPLAKSLSLDPEYLSALNLQTQLLIKTNRFHRALTSSLNALQIDPSDENAHRLHAQTLLKLGKYTGSRDHFQSALRIDPSSAESKAGLLEAVRSQYWIYPWISITNWRGILVMTIAFALAVAMGISTIWFKTEHVAIFFTCLIFTPFACISFAAKPIFNLFLQLIPRNKLLITSSISFQHLIFGNYLASLIIAVISLTYFFSCLGVISGNELILAIATPILLMIAGIFISTVTFLPTITDRRSLSLSLIYQLLVRGFGIVSIIALYIGANQVGTLYSIFFWLVILSPVVAIYTSKYAHR